MKKIDIHLPETPLIVMPDKETALSILDFADIEAHVTFNTDHPLFKLAQYSHALVLFQVKQNSTLPGLLWLEDYTTEQILKLKQTFKLVKSVNNQYLFPGQFPLSPGQYLLSLAIAPVDLISADQQALLLELTTN